MRVPTQISTRTRRVADVRPYEQGQGLDFSGLQKATSGLAAEIRQNQDDRQTFDINKRVVDETNELTGLYQTREAEQPLGAPQFAENWNSEVETRHQGILAEYKERGYNRKALETLDLRLSSVRGSFNQKAFGYQEQSVKAKAGQDLQQLGVGASQLAGADHNAYGSAIAEVEQGAELMKGTVDAITLARELDGAKATIRQAAGQGLALRDPELVISKLDPREQGTSTSNVSGFQNVAASVAETFGLNPLEVAAVMSFETGGSFDPNIQGGQNADGSGKGSFLGLIQFSKDNQQKYGITQGSTPEQWTAAITQYMNDRGFRKGMDIEDFYSTILTGGPGRSNKADINGTTPANAMNRILKDHLPKAEQWMAMATETETVEGAALTPDAKTGIAVLDDMSGPERMQVLAQAQAANRQNSAEIKAALEVASENEINAIKQGQSYAGPLVTEAELKKQYGDVIGGQKYAQQSAWRDAAPVIKAMPTTSVDQLTASVRAMKPADTSDPGYTRKLEVYNASKTAATAFIEARFDNPSSYVRQYYPNIANQFANANDPNSRKAAYGALANAYVQLGIPENLRLPIPKEQVAGIAAQYDGLASGQKLGQLDAWLKEMGPSGLFTNFAGQLNETSKSIKTDVFLYATLAGHPQFSSIMQNALDGETAMRVDPAQRPSPEALNKAYRQAFGGKLFGLNPDASANYGNAAAAIYVAQGGKVDSVGGSLASPDIFKDSLRQAVGGIKGDPNTGIVSLQGSDRPSTILPAGTNTTQWNNWLTRQTLISLSGLGGGLAPQTKSGASVSMQDIINEGAFIMKAPGVYEIQFKDNGVLLNPLGQPFRVRVSPQTIRGR